MQYESLIFDIDGTLWDSRALVAEGYNIQLEKEGLNHLFVDAADQAEFDDFVTQCMLRRMYDTGITAEYGDKLITLSTCEYSQTNGRLVIVAKRII